VISGEIKSLEMSLILHSRWWKWLLGVAALLAVVFGCVQWKLAWLEAAVWTRRAPHELAASRHFLEGFANGRILASWQARAQGLLGDLAYHQGEYEEALNRYSECAESVIEFLKSPEILLVTPAVLAKANAEFAIGFRDYQSHPVGLPPLNDIDLSWQHPADELTKTTWEAFLEIPSFDKDESAQFRQALRSSDGDGLDMTLVAEVGESQGAEIDALRRLTGPLIPTDPDAFGDLVKITDCARLLMLDAVRRFHTGDITGAAHSFDTAYTMLHTLENNPRLVTLLAAVYTRTEWIKLFQTAEGSVMRDFFEESHRLGESAWEEMAAGEYQGLKRILNQSLQGKGQQAERLEALTLAKQAAYWREVRADGAPSRSGPTMHAAITGWISKYRRYFLLGHKGNQKIGRQASADLEAAVAEILHQQSIVNLGSLREDLAELIACEDDLLR
jgi:hypothetical protein